MYVLYNPCSNSSELAKPTGLKKEKKKKEKKMKERNKVVRHKSEVRVFCFSPRPPPPRPPARPPTPKTTSLFSFSFGRRPKPPCSKDTFITGFQRNCIDWVTASGDQYTGDARDTETEQTEQTVQTEQTDKLLRSGLPTVWSFCLCLCCAEVVRAGQRRSKWTRGPSSGSPQLPESRTG